MKGGDQKEEKKKQSKAKIDQKTETKNLPVTHIFPVIFLINKASKIPLICFVRYFGN